MNSQMYELRTITENDYEFIYQVKKYAYKKYVEVYYGKWDEEQQKVYFEKFITTYGDGAFIITLGGKDIGFYNGITSDEISLQYFKCNPVGKLYERLGFKLAGETAYHYKMIIEKHV